MFLLNRRIALKNIPQNYFDRNVYILMFRDTISFHPLRLAPEIYIWGCNEEPGHVVYRRLRNSISKATSVRKLTGFSLKGWVCYKRVITGPVLIVCSRSQMFYVTLVTITGHIIKHFYKWYNDSQRSKRQYIIYFLSDLCKAIFVYWIALML